MIQRIVVTGSEAKADLKAVPVARSLAHQLSVPVSLLSVASGAAEAATRRDHLGKALRRMGERSIEIETMIDPSIAAKIVAEVEARDGTLLCMATHARRSLAEVVVGSVAEDVIRHIGSAVLVLGPKAAERTLGAIQIVLVALDGSRRAEAILPDAAGLAKTLRAELRLLRAAPPSLRMEPNVQSSGVDEERYLKDVAETVETRHGVEPSIHVFPSGEPARRIAEYAKQFEEPLIAMTTHGRTGIRKTVLGSVADDLLRTAPCPILLRGPTGTG